jgi:hypothetical protein
VKATSTINVSVATAGTLTSGTFAFYVSGETATAKTYAIAGSVALDANGNVTGGKQDYVSLGGPTSPSGGDTITGGKLTIASQGHGSLTLVTTNTAVGVSGTETFSISVVNSKHALIMEFDLSATSSGSIDFQTVSPGGLAQINGPFAFVVSGKSGSIEEAFGGFITGNGNGGLSILIDTNSGGAVVPNRTNSGSYTAPDMFGRGTMTFGGNNFAYYVVGPKVMRLVVLNAGEPDVGSAFAGATNTSNATLNKKFVFTDASNLSPGATFAAAGQMTMDGNGKLSSGFADVDENGTATSAAITGTYTVANSTGYASITITSGAQDISALGLYLTDPTINFSDPNSPADAGLCGLILDLDTKIVGSGMLIVPASGTPTLAGNFAIASQASNTNRETDAVGTAVVTGTSVTGTEDVDDRLINAGESGLDVASPFTGTLIADAANPGRFAFQMGITCDNVPLTRKYVVYQVSTTQLVLVQVDSPQFGLGILERQH